MTQYGIAKHRTSGERWAIALGHNAMIAEAHRHHALLAHHTKALHRVTGRGTNTPQEEVS